MDYFNGHKEIRLHPKEFARSWQQRHHHKETISQYLECNVHTERRNLLLLKADSHLKFVFASVFQEYVKFYSTSK